MAALSFNSQNSTFLPREDFFSGAETSLSNNLDDSVSPNSSNHFSASSTSPQSNSPGIGSRSCPPVTIPLSQPSNDDICSRYRELIERRTIPGIKSIEELTNWKPDTREAVFGCVFGVVRSVRDSKGTKFKYVTIIDPTNETGIELEAFGLQEKIAVGVMMKACNLKVQRTGSTLAFMFTPVTKTKFFPLFSYNYDDPMSDERNKALTQTRFSLPDDREICHVLEKWFSLKILNGTKLSNLPEPGEFLDICCQVLAYNKSPLCMNAVIWDTSEPKYKPFFGSDGRPPIGLECINYDYFHVAYERYFPLTVWKEEGCDQAQHYDTFKCIDLPRGDDLVVLFNLQVIEDPNHPERASLVMRSTRKWGKAVRLCHWNSVLGRMFLHRCGEYRKEFRRKLGLPDLHETDKPREIEPETDASQGIQKRKRKAVDEMLIEQFKSNNNDPQPSTSGYALRSRNLTSSEPLPVNQQSHNESPIIDILKHLQTKAEKFLNWDKLLGNGLEKLKLLLEVLEEGDLRDEASPLTREEHIQYIKLAIGHLGNQQESSASSTNTSHRSPEQPNDSDDSNMTEELFPVIPRVKYV